MAHTLTLSSHFRRFMSREPVRVSIHVDHGVPGSHLIWDIQNTSNTPITLTKLIVRGRRGTADTVPLGLPHVLGPQDHLVLPTDVDWSLLAATAVAAGDADGNEYEAPRRQLEEVRDRMRQSIDRRESPISARDFLFGAADMAFGVVILGLGFFMLMWAIATG
jgi:hypothetical protein